MTTEELHCNYDLSKIFNSSNLVEVEENNKINSLNLIEKKWYYKSELFNIIKYDKTKFNSDAGLFRSVICKNDKIVCYAPPKSLPIEEFLENTEKESVFIEEFIEGTMINIFWNNTEWEIATKSSIGGNVSFYIEEEDKERTFRWMFLDALVYYEENHNEESNFFTCLDSLPKNYSLSFVLQHPKNRIVIPFGEPSVYLVKCYEILDNKIKEIELSTISSILPSWVKYPNKINSTVEDILKSNNLDDYKSMGYVFNGVDSKSKTHVRSKIRNPSYEMVKRLRGNQPKLQYRYLMLRGEKNVNKYLSYYPEHKDNFITYRNLVHLFTDTLHKLYISCFIKKEKKLNDYPYEYKTHLFKLHEHYINDLVINSKVVTKGVVINYVNKLHPTLLMHSINYRFKKLINDTNMEIAI